VDRAFHFNLKEKGALIESDRLLMTRIPDFSVAT